MKSKPPSVQFFVVDILAINLSLVFSYMHYGDLETIPVKAAIVPLFMIFAWYVIVLNTVGMTPGPGMGVYSVLKTLLIAYSVLTAAVVFFVAVFSDFQVNNKLFLWALFFAAITSAAARLFYIAVMTMLLKKSLNKHILLIGGDRLAETVLNTILSRPSLGYTLIGVIADYYHPTLPSEIYLGRLDSLSEIARTQTVDEAIIALPLRRGSQIVRIVEACEKEGIRVRLVPDFFRFIRNSLIIEQLDEIPLIGIREVPLDYMKNRILKRSFDIVFSVLVLALLSPLFLVLTILVKISSPGPAFFVQERVGTNNRKFKIYKFRTMKVQPRAESDIVWTTPGDGRVTPIGRLLRRTNLDELPQFWNVLIGNMSVVGPRPEREHFVEEFRKRIFNYRVRHLIKSGITGLAQINGYRGDSSITLRVEYDIRYLENWTIWTDIKIILMTVFRRSAYRNAY